jgi:hypothetical protein
MWKPGLGLAAVFAAVLVGGAAGKAPPTGIEICGQGACRAIPQADAERIIISLDGSLSAPAAPGPFYILRWQWPNRPEESAWWVPRGGLARGASGLWRSQSVTSETALRTAAAGLLPLPAPTLTRAVVGRRVAENPQSYLQLLGGGEPAYRFDGARGWIKVHLASLEPNPWTDGVGVSVMVSKAGGWIRRDTWVYRISSSLAERTRQGRSLTPFSRAG